MCVLGQAHPAVGLSPVVRIASILLSAIASAAPFARAARTQVIAVCQVGGYCRGAHANRVSISWIPRRKVTNGHMMPWIGGTSIRRKTRVVAGARVIGIVTSARIRYSVR